MCFAEKEREKIRKKEPTMNLCDISRAVGIEWAKQPAEQKALY